MNDGDSDCRIGLGLLDRVRIRRDQGGPHDCRSLGITLERTVTRSARRDSDLREPGPVRATRRNGWSEKAGHRESQAVRLR